MARGGVMERGSVAVITARGGSKRIPRKNIREFCGEPILAYPVRAALESGIFDEVMVSTDDEEIAQIAREYGASVPFLRSGRTSGDHATTVDVLLEVLGEYGRVGVSFGRLCCVYPTAPFVTPEKLRDAMQMLEEPDVDSVMPVVAFSFPPMRGMHMRDGMLSYCHPECATMRSQDLETIYHDCGQFYCIKTDVLQRTGSLVTGRTRAMVLPEREVQDIDTLEDWELAEMKYRRMEESDG